MTAHESRPSRAETAPETFGGVSLSLPLDALDSLHAAFLAGVEYGRAQGQRMAAHHLAQEILSRQAAVMTGEAVATARAARGDAWAELIRQQAVAS